MLESLEKMFTISYIGFNYKFFFDASPPVGLLSIFAYKYQNVVFNFYC